MVLSPFDLLLDFFVCDKTNFNFHAIRKIQAFCLRYAPYWQLSSKCGDNMAVIYRVDIKKAGITGLVY
jgi:hypothetical protein